MTETQRLALQTATMQEQERIRNLEAETELLLAIHRNQVAKKLVAGSAMNGKTYPVVVAVAVGIGFGIGFCVILQALTN